MNDTELGQKILTAIKQVCAEQKEEVKMYHFFERPRGKENRSV